jgi:hypothetical protein
MIACRKWAEGTPHRLTPLAISRSFIDARQLAYSEADAEQFAPVPELAVLR